MLMLYLIFRERRLLSPDAAQRNDRAHAGYRTLLRSKEICRHVSLVTTGHATCNARLWRTPFQRTPEVQKPQGQYAVGEERRCNPSAPLMQRSLP